MKWIIRISIFIFLLPTSVWGQEVFFNRGSQAFSDSIKGGDKDAAKVESMINDAILALEQSIKEDENSSVKNRTDSFLFKPVGWTNDFSNLFTAEQVRLLDTIISRFEKLTTIEIAIVTIDFSFAMDKDFDSLITSIGNKWRVGKKEKHNGIVIGICKGLRKVRISNGYGIEAKLTDAETQMIIDQVIIPSFKNGDYFGGMKKALAAIINECR